MSEANENVEMNVKMEDPWETGRTRHRSEAHAVLEGRAEEERLAKRSRITPAQAQALAKAREAKRRHASDQRDRLSRLESLLEDLHRRAEHGYTPEDMDQVSQRYDHGRRDSRTIDDFIAHGEYETEEDEGRLPRPGDFLWYGRRLTESIVRTTGWVTLSAAVLGLLWRLGYLDSSLLDLLHGRVSRPNDQSPPVGGTPADTPIYSVDMSSVGREGILAIAENCGDGDGGAFTR